MTLNFKIRVFKLPITQKKNVKNCVIKNNNYFKQIQIIEEYSECRIFIENAIFSSMAFENSEQKHFEKKNF